MLNKIARMLSDPSEIAYRGAAALAPDRLWRRYARLCAERGVAGPYLVLSFDCDTEDDIAAAPDVHARLLDLGVKPVYAVPGELLRRGETVYRRIHESGAEFINHGGREHTYFDAAHGRHASCFFYDRQSPGAVAEDIQLGDRLLREVLGIAPAGFRTPHFGSYQKPAQLRYLHSVLQGLGYRFSTSTVPMYAYRFGPVFRDFGVAEIPVSGMASRPLRILDSWTCFAAPGRKYQPEDYAREGAQAAQRYADVGAGILNFYADPSHVRGRREFFDAVAAWARVARPTTYGELIPESA